SYSEKNITPVREGDTNTLNDSKHLQISAYLAETADQNLASDTIYVLPTLADLCKHFDVTVQSSDYVTDSDLSSHASYLKALHGAYISRTSGECSTLYCAQRLSVHPRTIQRYDEELNVIKTPIVAYEALSWHNVDKNHHYGSVEKGITPGLWLQRDDGKRFPAIKGIALQQLKAGHQLIACKQCPSMRQLATDDNPITQYEVYWVAPDGFKWGGALDTFPPQADIAYFEETLGSFINIPESSSQNDILSSTQALDQDFIKQARCSFYASEQQNSVEIHALLAQSRKEKTPTVDARINAQLTLVKGIGSRRADRLSDAGIHTMLDLIALPPEKIMYIFSYEQYISVRTIQAWIDNAKYLLGLRQLTPEERLNQKRNEEHRQFKKIYLTTYRSLQKLVDDLITYETMVGSYYADLTRLSQLLEEHRLSDTFYLEQGRHRIQRFVQPILEIYLQRALSFSTQTNSWLKRWGFGDAKIWAKFVHRIQKHLQEKSTSQ
ncbi:MAG: hypothetical protein WBC91_02080, partial [Phototrophicaceae bacterium]